MEGQQMEQNLDRLSESSRYWRAFSAGTPLEEARRAFRERYGADPAEVKPVPNNVLAGPVPGMESNPHPWPLPRSTGEG